MAAEKSLGLRVEDAFLSYQQQCLFQQLSFQLSAGEWTSLLGPSGVGKSSLLRFIIGTLTFEGTTRISGNVLTSDGHPLPGRVAYMAQRDALLPWLNILDNVLIGFKLRNELTPQCYEAAQKLLQQVGLYESAHKRPVELSGGMRQRVALCRTLLEDCPVVLMDEPFSALDAITRYQLQALAAELLQYKTVLLVTHDPLEALRLSHTIHLMKGIPAVIDAGLRPPGQPLRTVDDPTVLALQAQIIRDLADD